MQTVTELAVHTTVGPSNI